MFDRDNAAFFQMLKDTYVVRSFKFDVPEKPITWDFSGVNFPTMDGPDKAKPEMFLKIQRVEE